MSLKLAQPVLDIGDGGGRRRRFKLNWIPSADFPEDEPPRALTGLGLAGSYLLVCTLLARAVVKRVPCVSMRLCSPGAGLAWLGIKLDSKPDVAVAARNEKKMVST